MDKNRLNHQAVLPHFNWKDLNILQPKGIKTPLAPRAASPNELVHGGLHCAPAGLRNEPATNFCREPGQNRTKHGRDPVPGAR